MERCEICSFSFLSASNLVKENVSNTSGIPTCNIFNEISENKLFKIITTGNSKSYALDPMPTSLVNYLLPVRLPAIHKTVNRSLIESCMPDAPKGGYSEAASKKNVL